MSFWDAHAEENKVRVFGSHATGMCNAGTPANEGY